MFIGCRECLAFFFRPEDVSAVFVVCASSSFINLSSRDAASLSSFFIRARLMGRDACGIVLAGTGGGVTLFSSVAQYLVVAKAGVAGSQWWIR